MDNQKQPASKAIYHIRVKGKLDDKWADWFGSFTMTTRESRETLFSGTVDDQAELFGVLVKINNLGLPLLLVARVSCPCPEQNCPQYKNCQECTPAFSEKNNLPYCFRSGTEWDQQCLQLLNKKEEQI